MDVESRFPLLHRPDRWEWASATMTFSVDIPPDDLIVSTHVVGFVGGGDVVLCRADREAGWFLPGGTREPGEGVDASLARELMEEAGARMLGPFHRIGAHTGLSEEAGPYRPHLAHPFRAWLWGWADVEVIGPPTNPVGGEQVSEVRTFTLDEAVGTAVFDDAWVGELIELAAARRGHSGG